MTEFADLYIPGYPGHIGGPNGTITRIVMHGTVSPCQVGEAKSVAEYFQSPRSGGLAHYVVDPGMTVQCCQLGDWSWHAPPNPGSIGVELCDPQSGPGARWQDGPHQQMLARAAKLVANLCAKFSLPIARITASGLIAGAHGVTGHADVSAAWHESDHTDPGPDFPWVQFMTLVSAAAYKNPWPWAPNRLVQISGHPEVWQGRLSGHEPVKAHVPDHATLDSLTAAGQKLQVLLDTPHNAAQLAAIRTVPWETS